jgi:porin
MKRNSNDYLLCTLFGLSAQMSVGYCAESLSSTNAFAFHSNSENSPETTNAVGIVISPDNVPSSVPPSLRPFQLVLPKEHLLGDGLGLRPKMKDDGFDPSVTFVNDFAGNPIGGKSQGVANAFNLGINLPFDLEKLAGLQGASFLVSMSQRGGNSLSRGRIGNVFSVQQVYGGETFHLIDVAYQQKLLDNRIEFRVGRISAGDDFLVSPYDWIFMQNAFDGNPVGIFFNSPGMTAYPNATWGAMVKVRPTTRTYLIGGVYNGDPSIRDNSHNGADMSMNGPVFVIGEAGYQRNGLVGDSGLIGNYRVGLWYDNSVYTDYETAGYGTPTGSKRGNWGLYSLIDQVLVSFGDRSENSGLGIFGSALVSPDESVSQLPYFFTGGVAARGFFQSRPTDLAGFGVAYGEFSDDLRQAQDREQLFDPIIAVQDYETVLELTYRAYFRESAVFVQPDVQYVINPGGSGKIDNALVLGCQVGVNF